MMCCTQVFFDAKPVAELTKMMLARKLQLDEGESLATAFTLFTRLSKTALLARIGAVNIRVFRAFASDGFCNRFIKSSALQVICLHVLAFVYIYVHMYTHVFTIV